MGNNLYPRGRWRKSAFVTLFLCVFLPSYQLLCFLTAVCTLLTLVVFSTIIFDALQWMIFDVLFAKVKNWLKRAVYILCKLLVSLLQIMSIVSLLLNCNVCILRFLLKSIMLKCINFCTNHNFCYSLIFLLKNNTSCRYYLLGPIVSDIFPAPR